MPSMPRELKPSSWTSILLIRGPGIILHWFTNLVFNMMIFCFILRKALKVRRAGGDAQLADVLVRDGEILILSKSPELIEPIHSCYVPHVGHISKCPGHCEFLTLFSDQCPLHRQDCQPYHVDCKRAFFRYTGSFTDI